MSRSRSITTVTLLVASVALSGCGALQRLSEIGRPPSMTPTSDPTKAATWRPVTMPMPATEPLTAQADALWRPGSRAFFKDQRASRVGDIVTILVNMADTANLKDATTANRNGSETMGTPNLFGLENAIPHMLGNNANPNSLVSTNSTNVAGGTGQIQRNETVTLRVAAVVTQVLPNGNLVVMAHQEMRVNSELRDLRVSGVIRPEDITSDNTIRHDQMAEARISYGGRGELTDVQTPRYGQQLMDILLPF